MLVASLFALCFSQQDTASSGGELKIIGPKTLKDNWEGGKVEASPALFGIPVYNGQFVNTITYDASNSKACNKFSDASFFQIDRMDPHTRHFALIERGDCTFVEKVSHAQDAGAQAVIVFNNVDSDFLPIMADDGTGDRVSIPSVIISQADGEKIKAAIDQHASDVELEIKWGLPRPDGRVEWEMWTTADMTSREAKFIRDFKEVARAFGNKTLFTPHYNIASGMMEASDDDCTNGRKYCLFGWNGVQGKYVIKESLVQHCIWKWGQDNAAPMAWWEYVDLFQTNCAETRMWSGSCTATTLQTVTSMASEYNGLKSGVDKCIFDSGGTDGSDNTILDAEIASFDEYGIFWVPVVTINEEIYNGNLLCPHPVGMSTCGLFAAICAGFAPNTEPEICLTSHAGCDLGQARDRCGVCGGDGSSCYINAAKGIAAGFVIVIILLIAIVVGLLYYMRRRFRESDDQFDALRSMYEPLRDEPDCATSLEGGFGTKSNLDVSD